jgi:putative FmdB family regulatory protein
MPIYEYKCEICGRVFEKLILKPSNEGKMCPDCNIPCERLISKSSFVIHGYNAQNNYSK